MVRAAYRALTWTPVVVLSALFLLIMALPTIVSVVQHASIKAYFALRPPVVLWKPLEIVVDGPDVIVRGTLVKAWDVCEYMPPPRAEDPTGQHYNVISGNVGSNLPWPARAEPYRFGPWRIFDGAGKKLRLYQHHDCLDTSIFTTLGEVDTRKRP